MTGPEAITPPLPTPYTILSSTPGWMRTAIRKALWQEES